MRTRKNILLTSLFAILFASMTVTNLPPSVFAQNPVLAVDPPVIDGTPTGLDLTPGDSFYIEITIHDVLGMLGYEFRLNYDTRVLTANNFTTYPPFTEEWPSKINDTAGYVEMAYSYPLPEFFGLDVFPEDDPFTVARIGFTVDSFGYSPFDLTNTVVSNVSGGWYEHTVVAGRFYNTEIHDVAVTNVKANQTFALQNSTVSIQVTVKNNGTMDETFDVTAYSSGTPVAPAQTVTSLIPKTNTTLTFLWNTTGVSLGTYTISANASEVTGETNTADNSLTDGTVTVTLRAIQDIEVTNVTRSPSMVVVGDIVAIDVNVTNNGNVDGTFDARVYYDATLIETQTNIKLSPGETTTLNFDWNTTGVVLGTYYISANVSVVPGEYIYDDVDGSGNVTVGDRRLTAVGSYPAGSVVTSVDADVGQSIVVFASDEKHQEIFIVYDPGEYIYDDVDGSGNVTVGDRRLTAVGAYPAGSVVTPGNTDVGQSIVVFASNEKHQENIIVYNPGEYIYDDVDGSGNVTVGDRRLTAVGAYPAGSVVTPGDADVGQSIVVFASNEKHRENISGNSLYDPDEYIYEDVDSDGVVSVGDRRLTAVGSYPAGSVVTSVDADVGQPLVVFASNEKHQENIIVYDPDEYIYEDVDSDGVVSVGDRRLTAVGAYSAGSVVTPGDADVGQPLVVFASNEKHQENIIVYNPGEYIYDDVDGSGNVTVGDERLTAVGAYPAGSVVTPGDADVGQPLVVFASNEKHQENIVINSLYDPGETNTTNNNLIDGQVGVALHDINVYGLLVYPTPAVVGTNVRIDVVIRNQGRQNETFTVDFYYDDTFITNYTVTDLIPGALGTSLTVYWNTTGVATVSYNVTAEVPPLVGELDVADNVRTQEITIIPEVHDIAVIGVTPYLTTVIRGRTVTINVTIENQGNVEDTFSASVYYDTTLIETQTNIILSPGGTTTLNYTWNTADLALKTYTIKAEVPQVSGETDLDDNTKTAEVTVAIHDITLVSVTPSKTEVAIGDSITITVVVKNQGNFTESFNVTATYNGNTIGTTKVNNLAKGLAKTITFTWNTAGVSLGTYTISANASEVTDEENTTNNSLEGGAVMVKLSSTISILATSSTVTVGGKVTLNGSIDPTREGVTVTIWYRIKGTETWNNLTATETDANGQYSYEWTPKSVGNYELRASWQGDVDTLGDQSDIQDVTVKETTNLLPYAAAAAAAFIVIAIVLVYITKIRKPK